MTGVLIRERREIFEAYRERSNKKTEKKVL